MHLSALLRSLESNPAPDMTEVRRCLLLAANALDSQEMGLRRLLGELDSALAEADECNCNPAERTGGDHDPKCPAWEPECTCYEIVGGHQSMCPFGVALRQRRERPAEVKTDG